MFRLGGQGTVDSFVLDVSTSLHGLRQKTSYTSYEIVNNTCPTVGTINHEGLPHFTSTAEALYKYNLCKTHKVHLIFIYLLSISCVDDL